MAVPTSFAELSTTAASNPPADTEGVSQGDDQFRAVYSFIRQLYEGTNNGQIVFPATQNASSGANTLDDYEEGTWTPTITFGGAAVGVTYSVQTGRYIKIGRLVYVAAKLALTSKGSSTGGAVIAGLPFTVFNSDATGIGAFGFYSGLASLTGTPTIMVSPTSTAATLYHPGAAAATAMTDANFQNTADIRFALCYEATA
jgi:hypothetical protein